MTEKTTEKMSDHEVAKRRDEALKRALNTPPKQHRETRSKERKTKKRDETAR